MDFRWLGPRLPRNNNFDIIRLFAAVQVMLVHATSHLGIVLPYPWAGIVSAFPGVPIFFFISGLLVTSSLAGRDLAHYAQARAHRVFPALWLAFALAVTLLVSFRQITSVELAQPVLWLWAASQITIFQVFNPDMFRDFGVGVVNGSLWTIPVEIGFYFILPALVWLSARASDRKGAISLILATAACASFAIDQITRPAAGGGSALERLIQFSPAAHLWQFALGSLAYVHFDVLMRALQRLNRLPLRWLAPLAAYLALVLLLAPMLPPVLTDMAAAALLYAAVFSLALGAPPIAGILRGADISYGLYLFHMLVVNALVASGWRGWGAILPAMAISVLLAWLSWIMLESRVLRRRSIERYPTIPARVAPSQLAATGDDIDSAFKG
jgi:peptidoglycan/LPS O-acetylase OafA/YrhL